MALRGLMACIGVNQATKSIPVSNPVAAPGRWKSLREISPGRKPGVGLAIVLDCTARSVVAGWIRSEPEPDPKLEQGG